MTTILITIISEDSKTSTRVYVDRVYIDFDFWLMSVEYGAMFVA